MSNENYSALKRHLMCPHISLIVLVALTLTACAGFDIAETQRLCNQSCTRQQISNNLIYWEEQDSTPLFYGWLRTLSDEQLGWIRDDMAEMPGSQSPESSLREAIVLSLGSDDTTVLQGAARRVDTYLKNAVFSTENYAFALLVQSALSNRINAHQRGQFQVSEISELKQELKEEQDARAHVEEQLDRLKQIEESLLGSIER